MSPTGGITIVLVGMDYYGASYILWIKLPGMGRGCDHLNPTSFSSLQAKNSFTNEIVAIKKMNFSGKQSTEVRPGRSAAFAHQGVKNNVFIPFILGKVVVKPVLCNNFSSLCVCKCLV